jgi:cyanate permease
VSTTLVTRWFDKQRAVALSVASTGLSVGGIVMTPIARHLLRHHELGAATSRIALLYLVGVIPACLLFLRADPARFGLGPDGHTLAADHDQQAAIQARGGTHFADAVTSIVFYGITATFLLALGSQVGAIAQLDKLAHERIATEVGAARIVSVLAACSVIGRLSGSVVLPRLGNRRFTALILATQAIGLALLSRVHGTVAVTVATIVLGVAIGNVLLLHPLLLATSFGVRDYPRIYGRSQAVMMIGTAGGPFLYGYLRDHAGGYRTSYLVGAGLTVASLGLYLLTCGDGNDAVRVTAASTA